MPHASWRECADTFFSFFRFHVCRIRFYDSVVIFLFRMFAASFFLIPPRSGTPLLLAIQFPLLGLVRDLHPLDNAHAERTNKEALSGLPYMESAVCICMTGC